MSKKKAGGKIRQQANVAGKRLGLKVSGGEKVQAGNILIRQRGTAYHAGQNVRVGRDHTLYATSKGSVSFKERSGKSVMDVV
ncbi:MAG: 50S ribosomal protein L27 [Candidatus Blackburnbacteria bacterium RIFCSPHIGHO2_01_FULL_43_15b]|uniref:Large ribosomal subunit protein bL27 n=1 Tax=Candidatus Blackburnbacteria bacterium RIFCSPHIGHO2_01_FULL_43_15b TaxID=1797513 RepID=A0A1G1V2V7_9BACT|nr:MAG: 50S ribosomal protein L27 [Candidatus Blackburnbacteria bacterium RIFCSPHIGHO2_01_FULL_43_15b]